MKNIHLIAAARPNFMKVAPLYRALITEAPWCQVKLIHTGQHYDENMSGSFLKDLGLPSPHISLAVGSGTHAEQTGKTMIAYEKVVLKDRPDLIVVAGDVNATAACALVGAKCHIPVAHLEAGLRSGDRDMPEEINRIVTDSISSLLWTPSSDADANLVKEGHPPERIVPVGNIMIDSLLYQWDRIQAEPILSELGLSKSHYIPVTLHRPSNVDSPETLSEIISALETVSTKMRVVFPVHPRTAAALSAFGLFERLKKNERVTLLDPLPYNSFLKLVADAALLITDSGGIQEETTFLGIPCLTLRSTTERPITILEGTNKLTTVRDLVSDVDQALRLDRSNRKPPHFWDGKTAARVVASITEFLHAQPSLGLVAPKVAS